jgi:hypothetical protein
VAAVVVVLVVVVVVMVILIALMVAVEQKYMMRGTSTFFSVLPYCIVFCSVVACSTNAVQVLPNAIIEIFHPKFNQRGTTSLSL